MADVTVIKNGGLFFGADDYSKAYIAKQPSGCILQMKVVNKKLKRRDILNRLSHAIYSEAAKQKGDGYADDEKAYCKYHHGIPVLIHDQDDGEECQDYYKRLLNGVPYEQRIERMKASHRFYIPVTSLMTDMQMFVYIKRVEMDYAKQGIVILTPKERDQLANYDKQHGETP